MSNLFDNFREQLGYMLSLPERTVRSLAAVAGGTTALVSDLLLPDTLRGTSFYRVLVGDTQRFVIEQVAQVQKEGQAVDAGGGEAVGRKILGSALDAAGLFGLRFSPLWVFALVDDTAAGGNRFLGRLVEQLKANGVIPKHAQIQGITDLLSSIQDGARRSAAAVESPPLSRDELAHLADELKTAYTHAFHKGTDLLPRLETIWQSMEQLARRENISLQRLSGILSVELSDIGRRGLNAVKAVGQTGRDFVGEEVLDSYSRTLDAINKTGLANYVSTHMRPFLDNAAGHFDPGRKTWTESMLGLGSAKPDAASEAATAEAAAGDVAAEGACARGVTESPSDAPAPAPDSFPGGVGDTTDTSPPPPPAAPPAL
jgi:hypothetical protein